MQNQLSQHYKRYMIPLLVATLVQLSSTIDESRKGGVMEIRNPVGLLLLSWTLSQLTVYFQFCMCDILIHGDDVIRLFHLRANQDIFRVTWVNLTWECNDYVKNILKKVCEIKTNFHFY